METNVGFNDLPFELIEWTFSFLSPASLIGTLSVSRSWFDLARSDRLWKGFTLQYLGNCPQEKSKKRRRNRKGRRKELEGNAQELEKVAECGKELDGFSYFRMIQQRVKECNALIGSIKAEPEALYLWQRVPQVKRSIVRLIRWAAQYDYHVLLRKWIALK